MSWYASEESEGRWRKACDLVRKDPAAITTFRALRGVGTIVDTMTDSHAQKFVDAFEVLLPEKWDLFHKRLYSINDTVGQPEVTDFDGVSMSRATVRYAFRVWDLVDTFGSLDGMHIVEIGGGYGGLAALVCMLYTPASYTLYDIPEAVALQSAYLREFYCPTKFHFEDDPSVIRENVPDLLISDCAISELDGEGRSQYAGLVKGAKRGSVVWGLQTATLLEDRDAWKWLSSTAPNAVVVHAGVRSPSSLIRCASVFAPGIIHYRWYWYRPECVEGLCLTT